MDLRALIVPPVAGLTKTVRIMRLTTFLLLAACLQVSARSYSQTVTLSEKNAPLEKVFREIKRQTGYNIFYNDNLLANAGTVTLDLKNASIDETLTQCFRDQPFTYTIDGRTIVISPKDPKKEEIPPPPIDLHGRITNEKGEPLEGVTILIKGTKAAALTDADGAFALKGVDANAILVITYVSYETQEIKLAGKTALVIKLKLSNESLKEAVVNKGYYNTTQALNTGNVAIVKGEDIAKQPVTDPILALEGRVAGLSIAQISGVPGSYSAIRLRGENTIPYGKPITANDPLYIVDGVPFGSQTLTSEFIGGGIFQTPSIGNGTPVLFGAGQGMSPFNVLNPADIENIEVLKDADATAIYGSRGANGIIIITTKKGKAGRSKLDVSMYSGASKVTRTLKMLNTPQYLEMRREAINNDGFTSYLTPQYAPFFRDLLIWDTTRYTDWQKVLLSNSNHFTNAQVNYSGGSANTQFMIGGGYSRQDALFPGNYADKIASIHIAVTNHSANQRLTTQILVDYSNGNNNMPQVDFTHYIGLPPNAPAIFDKLGNLNYAPYGGAGTFGENPFQYTVSRSKAISQFYSGNFVFDYKLLKGLNFRCNAGYSQQSQDATNITPSRLKDPPANNNPLNRYSSFSQVKINHWIVEPQLNYSREIAKGTLEFSLGTTFQETTRDSRAETAQGFSSDALIADISAASVQSFAGADNSLYHYAAMYGRMGYNWEGKYVVNLTGRRDGSSRFGPNRQFGNFGAIGAGWIFSKEKWIEDHLSFLSFGKIRGSYGITGNDNIGDYQFLSTYSPNGFAYQNLSGLKPTLMPNPYFQWEKVGKLEGGLEIGLLRDAINFTVSVYRNRTYNQLVAYPLPLITGFGAVEENLPAVIQNSGFEITMHTKNISTGTFTWTTDFNISISRNKLVSFPGIENTDYRYLWKVGQSLSSIIRFNYTGVDPQTGVYNFQTKDGSGRPSEPQDWYATKPVTQKYFGGFLNSFTYKRFQLDLFVQFVDQFGYNYKFSFDLPGSYHSDGLENQPVAVLNRWQKPGDNAEIQQFSAGYGLGGSRRDRAYLDFGNSSGSISDASFLRLKNISFSYNPSLGFLKKGGIEDARIYLQCQNLFTITSYQGLDPESQGISLPPLRTITAGIAFSL